APATLVAQPAPEPEPAPLDLAAAASTPAPAAPMAIAAEVAQPPAQPEQEEPEEPEEPDEPLKLVSKVNPTMPRQLQQGTFRNGVAQVQFTVATDGSVQQASVIKATHSRLGTAAVDAVRQWRFAPLRKPREAAVEVAFKNETE
ncbi:MAG: energy transducer TonB, partial [Roseateles sp.]